MAYLKPTIELPVHLLEQLQESLPILQCLLINCHCHMSLEALHAVVRIGDLPLVKLLHKNLCFQGTDQPILFRTLTAEASPEIREYLCASVRPALSASASSTDIRGQIEQMDEVKGQKVFFIEKTGKPARKPFHFRLCFPFKCSRADSFAD
jgi:hypothetical protein